MTPKQRIITALRNEQPDVVPVTLGLSEMVPVRRSGLSYVDFFWREQRNLARERTDCERFFGADVFIHSAEAPGPDDPEVTVVALRDSPEEVIYRETVHTPHGELSGVKRITVTESPAVLEGMVKDPVSERDKVLDLLQHPEGKDFSGYLRDWEYVGEDGHCGFWISTPVDWWAALRGGPEQAIYDFADHPRLIHDLFTEYTRYAVALLDRFLREHLPQADSIGLGGSTTSMSVLSPRYLQEYTVPFVQAVSEVARRYGVPTQYHMCGRSRQAIPLLVEAGVGGMDALECPPTGDVDLGEVKRTFGDRISLRGNVNSITTMLRGTPEDVEREVLRCMNDAKAGGGFILGVGDQTPYWTPEENLWAFVEAGRKYGRY